MLSLCPACVFPLVQECPCFLGVLILCHLCPFNVSVLASVSAFSTYAISVSLMSLCLACVFPSSARVSSICVISALLTHLSFGFCVRPIKSVFSLYMSPFDYALPCLWCPLYCRSFLDVLKLCQSFLFDVPLSSLYWRANIAKKESVPCWYVSFLCVIFSKPPSCLCLLLSICVICVGCLCVFLSRVQLPFCICVRSKNLMKDSRNFRRICPLLVVKTHSFEKQSRAWWQK